MSRKSTLITAGAFLAAAAAGAGLVAYRKRRSHAYEEHLQALAALDPGRPDSTRHKKERTPRKLKKHARAGSVPADSSHAGTHW